MKNFRTLLTLFVLLAATLGIRSIFSEEEVNSETRVEQPAPTPIPAKRVGIQVGHLDAAKLPDELESLSWNFGASSGGVNEVDVNQNFANAIAQDLRAEGIEVDILPATVPIDYKADLFISLHADGNEETYVTGFKAASSIWNTDGRSSRAAAILIEKYGKASGLEFDDTITPNMTRYYAFNYQRFDHAIDESTPGVLFELGYITNANDRRIMTQKTETLASALSEGILEYLNTDGEVR